MDIECKRYFNFDGVVVGVLYLLHKYMPDYYQKQSYDDLFTEYLKRNKTEDFTKHLKEDLFSASNNLLKVDKLIDVEMIDINGHKQRALIDVEIQNKYQTDYWKRACNYLCRIRSEYFHYLRVRYPNEWIPIISCWFMTNRTAGECPFVIYTPYTYEQNNERYLLLTSISFQYSKYPPKTDDEIELAFYKLLSPYSKEKERMEGCKILHCNITEEEVKKMCNYSEVCIMLGREEGIAQGKAEGLVQGKAEGIRTMIKIMLRSKNIDEVIDVYGEMLTKQEIIAIQDEMLNES